MSRQHRITHEFVDFIPAKRADGVLYVSMKYATAAHNCCCGCGLKVVTPITPTDWKLIFDGDTVSLFPSIGNWSYPCQSHYWIREGNVVWAGRMKRQQIENGRTRDRLATDKYFAAGPIDSTAPAEVSRGKKPSWWRILKKWASNKPEQSA